MDERFMRELLDEANRELTEEDKAMAKELLKERIREIAACRRALQKMEKQYQALLEKSIEEVVDELVD